MTTAGLDVNNHGLRHFQNLREPILIVLAINARHPYAPTYLRVGRFVHGPDRNAQPKNFSARDLTKVKEPCIVVNMIQVVTGYELRARLERLGLSPEQFAEKAGVSNMTIRNHEQGRVLAPRRSTARKISGALARLEAQMEATKDTPKWM